jgi:hypothetical protein
VRKFGIGEPALNDAIAVVNAVGSGSMPVLFSKAEAAVICNGVRIPCAIMLPP